MTREEAIDILRHLYSRCNWETTTCDFYGCDKCEDALNMAIEALKRERIKCSHCKHYIRHDHRCGWWNHGVSNVDWCSYGERKQP